MSTTDMYLHNTKFMAICKPRTLNDGAVKTQFSTEIAQKSQKALLLSSSHFAFYRLKL